jgi:hypothetical protein
LVGYRCHAANIFVNAFPDIFDLQHLRSIPDIVKISTPLLHGLDLILAHGDDGLRLVIPRVT